MRAPESGLLARLRAGDEAAFAALADDLAPALRSVARLHLGPAGDVDGAVRRAWIAVLDGLTTAGDGCALRALAFRALLDDVATLNGPRAVPGSTAPDRAAQAIAELPPTQRAVIALRDVAGRPAPEVCQALGVSPERMRRHLHRARVRVNAAVHAGLAQAA